LNRLDKAQELLERKLELARQLNDRRGESAALGNLGNVYDGQGELHRAIECHEQQLEICREIGDRQGEGNALWNIGLALRQIGEQEKACTYARAALKVFIQIESPYAGMVREQLTEWYKGKASTTPA
jgi:tetratricopeptide (TPR) repeat protein